LRHARAPVAPVPVARARGAGKRRDERGSATSAARRQRRERWPQLPPPRRRARDLRRGDSRIIADEKKEKGPRLLTVSRRPRAGAHGKLHAARVALHRPTAPVRAAERAHVAVARPAPGTATSRVKTRPRGPLLCRTTDPHGPLKWPDGREGIFSPSFHTSIS
jgi:hypothetical protein